MTAREQLDVFIAYHRAMRTANEFAAELDRIKRVLARPAKDVRADIDAIRRLAGRSGA